MLHDKQLLWLMGGLVGLLLLATAIGQWLRLRGKGDAAVIANLNQRTNAWWAMVAVFMLSVLVGRIGSIVLFAAMSFLALREYVALAPTTRSDHRPLLQVFFIFLPAQYIVLGMQWYELFAVLIPVYGFALLPLRTALAGDTQDFLARTSSVQWGLMVCVYCLSHAPALLMLDLPGFPSSQNYKLLLFLSVVAQLSDVLQYVVGKLFGKHRIAPLVSPNKTVEGAVGGIALASLVGAGLWWITPFSPLQAGVMALLICIMGFAGGLVMSAVKRDRGVKDYGSILPGHGGMLDRVDSLCFSAPVFFHITRYWFG